MFFLMESEDDDITEFSSVMKRVKAHNALALTGTFITSARSKLI